jgi:hypothetical protein
MNTSPNETKVHGAGFAERVYRNQQQLGARGALVRRLGAFERMYHRYEQKSTMHFCVVAELADDLDPAGVLRRPIHGSAGTLFWGLPQSQIGL